MDASLLQIGDDGKSEHPKQSRTQGMLDSIPFGNRVIEPAKTAQQESQIEKHSIDEGDSLRQEDTRMFPQKRREEQSNQPETDLNKPQEMLGLPLGATRLDEPNKFISGNQDEACKDEQDNHITEFFQCFTHGFSAFFRLLNAYVSSPHFSRLHREVQLAEPIYAGKKDAVKASFFRNLLKKPCLSIKLFPPLGGLDEKLLQGNAVVVLDGRLDQVELILEGLDALQQILLVL